MLTKRKLDRAYGNPKGGGKPSSSMESLHHHNGVGEEELSEKQLAELVAERERLLRALTESEDTQEQGSKCLGQDDPDSQPPVTKKSKRSRSRLSSPISNKVIPKSLSVSEFEFESSRVESSFCQPNNQTSGSLILSRPGSRSREQSKCHRDHRNDSQVHNRPLNSGNSGSQRPSDVHQVAGTRISRTCSPEPSNSTDPLLANQSKGNSSRNSNAGMRAADVVSSSRAGSDAGTNVAAVSGSLVTASDQPMPSSNCPIALTDEPDVPAPSLIVQIRRSLAPEDLIDDIDPTPAAEEDQSSSDSDEGEIDSAEEHQDCASDDGFAPIEDFANADSILSKPTATTVAQPTASPSSTTVNHTDSPPAQTQCYDDNDDDEPSKPDDEWMSDDQQENDESAMTEDTPVENDDEKFADDDDDAVTDETTQLPTNDTPDPGADEAPEFETVDEVVDDDEDDDDQLQQDDVMEDVIEENDVMEDNDDGIETDASDDLTMDIDNVDEMLETHRKTAVEESERNWSQLKEPPNLRLKKVLKHRRQEYFEVLPDGWIEITHSSGVPVYLHKATRVCTFSRPYFIGPGSARHHDVPISAIPCYYYQKLKEWDKQKKLAAAESLVATQTKDSSAAPGQPAQKSTDQTNDSQSKTNPPCPFADPQASRSREKSTDRACVTGPSSSGTQQPAAPSPAPGKEGAASADSTDRPKNLSSTDLHQYCLKLFEFNELKVWRFHNWADHRHYHKMKKFKRSARPGLPENVKLIPVPKKTGSRKPNDMYLNPHGKTSVALLHEYIQRVMQCAAEYELGQTNSASEPYSATVIIQGTRYSTGYGNNKRQAKLDAAQRTLSVLIPNVDFAQDATVKLPNEDDVLALFDLFSITDSRVYELSVKAGQPAPYQVLMECLKRNATFGDTQLQSSIAHVRHQQHEYTMTVGKDADAHEVKVMCPNKKEGKQKASQYMLEKLHPHIRTWGSLLRLYTMRGSKGSVNSSRKVLGGPSCALGPNALPPCLPGASGHNNGPQKPPLSKAAKRAAAQRAAGAYPIGPNKAILERLRREMRRFYTDDRGRDASPSSRDPANPLGTSKARARSKSTLSDSHSLARDSPEGSSFQLPE